MGVSQNWGCSLALVQEFQKPKLSQPGEFFYANHHKVDCQNGGLFLGTLNNNPKP